MQHRMKLLRNKTCDYFYELTPGVILPTSFPGSHQLGPRREKVGKDHENEVAVLHVVITDEYEE